MRSDLWTEIEWSATSDSFFFIARGEFGMCLQIGHNAEPDSEGPGFSPCPVAGYAWHVQFSNLSMYNKKETIMLKTLWNDESGVILSAEIVLVGTILVLGMIVGLVELQCAVVGELSDLSSAIGNFSQSFQTTGFLSAKTDGSAKARTYGASYTDRADQCDCDLNLSLVCNDPGEVVK